MASRPHLTPAEILSEWRLYSTMEDPTLSGVCICGKTGLRYDKLVKAKHEDHRYYRSGFELWLRDVRHGLTMVATLSA